MICLFLIGSCFVVATYTSACLLPKINCETAWEQMPNKLYQVISNDDPFDEVTTCRTITNIEATIDKLKLNFTSFSEKFGHDSFVAVFQKEKPGVYRVIISEQERKDLGNQKFVANGKKEENVGNFVGELNSYLELDHIFYSCDGKILIHVWCNENGKNAVHVSKGDSRPTAEDALYVRNTFIKWQNGWENLEIYTSSCSEKLASSEEK